MLAPGTEVGRYVIRRKLAEGGMAEIFVARAVGPEGFSKDVVIKAVHGFLSRDQQFVQMFIAEARLASKLNHANVVQIFDFGKHEESYYLAMEYVRGTSLWDLRKRCREDGIPFPPTLAAEIGAQVARGLQYAHSLSENGQKLGVVHRDVTPHNVLLSFDGAVKLTDFGIAKAQTTHTAPGMLKGKFAYMSPEQSRGDKVDARTDVFALGIVLWELLTGGRLFSGDSDLAVLRAVQEALIAPPARVNPDVPQDLSDIVMKALARNVDERFQTAFELEKALANFVLRSAKSVEETSVALFLQQLMKEEFEAPSLETDVPSDQTMDEDFGVGGTVARAPKTEVATPAPRLVEKTLTTPAGPQPQPGAANGRPKTEQMPMVKPSRKLPPLPMSEPSVVVRESVRVLPKTELAPAVEQSDTQKVRGNSGPRPKLEPSISETERYPSVHVDEAQVLEASARQTSPETVPPRSKTPFVVLGLLGLVIVLGVGVLVSGEQAPAATAASEPVEPAPAPTPEPKPEVAASPSEPPVEAPPPVEVAKPAEVAKPVEPPAPTPEPAKPVAVAETLKPEPAPAPVKAAPVARKMGAISVKAVPYATVIIQGRSYEVTGVQKLPAPAGTYEISLEHPKKKLKERVTVQPNETTSVSFSAD